MGDKRKSETLEAGDDATNCKAIRDPLSRKIVALQLRTEHTDREFKMERYSTVMVKSGFGEAEFLACVRGFIDPGGQRGRRCGQEDDLEVKVCWFYRSYEVTPPQPDSIIQQAKLSRGVDQGRFKEIFYSNHEDVISLRSVMAPIKVWFVRNDSVSCLMVPSGGISACGTGGPSTSAAPAELVARQALLPGFVCRRFYDCKLKQVLSLVNVTLSALSSDEEAWVVKNLTTLIIRSEEERKDYMVEWLQRCAARLSQESS